MKTFFLVLIVLSLVLVEISAGGHRGHHDKHRRHGDRDHHHHQHRRDHHRRHDRDHHDRDHDDWDHRRHHERGHHQRRHHHNDDDDHHRRNQHHKDDRHDRHDRHHRRHQRDHHRRRNHHDRHDRYHDKERYEIGLHHVLGKILHKWESKAFQNRFRHNEWDFDARILGDLDSDYSQNDDNYYGEQQQQPQKYNTQQHYQPEDKPTTPNYPDNNIGEDETPYGGEDETPVEEAPQFAPEMPEDNHWDNETEIDGPETESDEHEFESQVNVNSHNDNNNNHHENIPVPTPKVYKSSKNPGKGEGVLTPIKQGKSETTPNHGSDETIGLVDQVPAKPDEDEDDQDELVDNNENMDNSTDVPVPEGLIRRKSEDSAWVLGLAIGIPAGIVVVALIVVGILLYRRKQSLVEVEIDVPEKGWVTHT